MREKARQVVADEAERHPQKAVDVFASDEHRLGLKPFSGCYWASRGARPLALGHHRFEWLYGTAFGSPRSGETFWYLSNGVSKPFYEALLALFAREAGAGDERFIILVIDGAGWHAETRRRPSSWPTATPNSSCRRCCAI